MENKCIKMATMRIQKTNFPFSREVLYELKYNPSLNASQNNTLEEIETLRL